MWRLRPLTFFPPSYPCSPPLLVVLTDWLSMIPKLGSGSRPDSRFIRTFGEEKVIVKIKPQRHREHSAAQLQPNRNNLDKDNDNDDFFDCSTVRTTRCKIGSKTCVGASLVGARYVAYQRHSRLFATLILIGKRNHKYTGRLATSIYQDFFGQNPNVCNLRNSAAQNPWKRAPTRDAPTLSTPNFASC